ncbi:UvrB/UvrC motif-containing protein [Bacillus manliponensis]|uniref:UvrB/UvrC motif-containing protein n=1 Tax=Bacillus manliponensis TaxID=574376 RepID=UPI003517E275
MICQNCNSKQATLHFTKVINGKKAEVHLCQQCAGESGYTSFFQSSSSSFSFQDLLAGLLNGEQPKFEKPAAQFTESQVLQCQICHTTYEQFANRGRFGCSNCYETFKGKLKPMLKRLHGGYIDHHGKIPKRIGGNIRLKKELHDLKQKLKQCIEQEAFEEAATVRDEMRHIETRLSEHREGE